jgi:hypothetical protein
VTLVTLYTRSGCHLCDEAREAILGLREELPPFEMSEVDIDTDPVLHARYLERIPVVEVDGVEISELAFDPRLLRVRFGTVRP